MEIKVNVDNIGNYLADLLRALDIVNEETKRHSEVRGMLNLINCMDIEYDIEWNKELTEMTAVVIAGQRFEV